MLATMPRDQRVVDAVIVDYGGVLTTPMSDLIVAWIEADGIEPESLTETLRDWLSSSAPTGTPIHLLETGDLPAHEFEQQLAARLRTTHGKPVEAKGLLRRLFAGSGPDHAMIELLHELRELGLRTALLSNSWGNKYPREVLDEVCDIVVISEEVGIRKPDPAMYEAVRDKLGISAERCVFIDDAKPNVQGAAAVGMHAILHTDATSTRARLRELVPGLPETPEEWHAEAEEPG
jgi:putative hydrolase of the HAD superfamily